MADPDPWADSYARARCNACGTLLGGSIPAYKFHFTGTSVRQLLCAPCCAEWRRWTHDDPDPVPYTVYRL